VGRGLLSLFGELLGEEIANREYGNVCVYVQIQEVIVTRYNVGSIGDDGTAEENIIVRVSNHNGGPVRHLKDRSQVTTRGSILSDWSEAEIVSKGAANAVSLGKPAPFDTHFTAFRATLRQAQDVAQDAELRWPE